MIYSAQSNLAPTKFCAVVISSLQFFCLTNSSPCWPTAATCGTFCPVLLRRYKIQRYSVLIVQLLLLFPLFLPQHTDPSVRVWPSRWHHRWQASVTTLQRTRNIHKVLIVLNRERHLAETQASGFCYEYSGNQWDRSWSQQSFTEYYKNIFKICSVMMQFFF